MDMALISQMATLESRVPVLHFFDGFRTSHEEMKVEEISYDDMRALIDDDLVRAHRYNRLSPIHRLFAVRRRPRCLLPGQGGMHSIL